jgi:Uncharacterized conserved protein
LEGRNDGKSLEGYRDRMREVFGRYVLEEGEIDGEEAKELLDSLPGAFHNERMMLEHILEYRHDYIGAMRLLPKYFRLIIVQSYQSYLFNRVLSRLVEKSGIGGLPAEVPWLATISPWMTALRAGQSGKCWIRKESKVWRSSESPRYRKPA